MRPSGGSAIWTGYLVKKRGFFEKRRKMKKNLALTDYTGFGRQYFGFLGSPNNTFITRVIKLYPRKCAGVEDWHRITTILLQNMFNKFQINFVLQFVPVFARKPNPDLTLECPHRVLESYWLAGSKKIGWLAQPLKIQPASQTLV
jgi:hypothetical protein